MHISGFPAIPGLVQRLKVEALRQATVRVPIHYVMNLPQCRGCVSWSWLLCQLVSPGGRSKRKTMRGSDAASSTVEQSVLAESGDPVEISHDSPSYPEEECHSMRATVLPHHSSEELSESTHIFLETKHIFEGASCLLLCFNYFFDEEGGSKTTQLYGDCNKP